MARRPGAPIGVRSLARSASPTAKALPPGRFGFAEGGEVDEPEQAPPPAAPPRRRGITRDVETEQRRRMRTGYTENEVLRGHNRPRDPLYGNPVYDPRLQVEVPRGPGPDVAGRAGRGVISDTVNQLQMRARGHYAEGGRVETLDVSSPRYKCDPSRCDYRK